MYIGLSAPSINTKTNSEKSHPNRGITDAYTIDAIIDPNAQTIGL
jgi:hypothetical protein